MIRALDRPRQLILLLVLLLGALPIASCLRGQKLLLLEVIRGSEVVVATNFDADDRSTALQIWDEAGEVPFATLVVSESLQPSADDPLRASVAGPVTIRITHVDTIEATVTLSDVTLSRTSPAADDWRLTEAEIRRAKAAAGL